MGQRFKVHELLKGDELAELETFAREPGRTIDECHQWLQERGFTLSRDAVYNWKFAFDQELTKLRFSRSSELAGVIRAAAKESGAVGVADATLETLVHVLFEQSSMLQSDGRIDSADLANLTLGLKRIVGTKMGIEKLREEYEQKQQTALKHADEAVKAGVGAGDVVKAMKEALGITA